MKKFLHTTVLLVAILMATFANAKTKLTINTSMPSALKVIIDGHKFYTQDNNLNIRNIQPGYHNITIYYIKNGRDFNNYYSNNGYSNLWKKAVSRQVVVRNNYQYDITINRFGRAFYDQDYYTTHNYNNGWGRNENDDNDDEDDMYNNDNNFDYENGYSEDYNDMDYFKGRANNNGNNNNDKRNDDKKNNDEKLNNSNGFSNYKPVMSNTTFAQVKQTMDNQSFETSKLEFAKQTVENRAMTTQQVIDLMNLLSMETSKLDFAKYAYKSVVDKDRYFTVTNQLTMQTSKDELLQFIKPKK